MSDQTDDGMEPGSPQQQMFERLVAEGGTAFPAGDPEQRLTWTGMSLRDWFAGQAMATLVKRWETMDMVPDSGGSAKIAKYAYAMADAMLEARKS